ncbi:hypothetical protein [Candidatus Leptofilum sp.]|uniref:hypothetical protein n=1 Tax=Candidatus Leptofilum sp. TaxID=3241576 RepID=UPI003B5B0813
MKRLVLFFLIPLFLLACSPSEVTLVPYSSTNYPITFEMPDGWAINDDKDSITIASEEDLLLASSVAGGARVNLTVTSSLFMGVANATDVVEAAVRNFLEQEEGEELQAVESTVINGQTAVQTVIRAQDTQGTEIILRYVVIENLTASQTAVVAAVHDASQNNEYGQLMADIVNSIQLGEAAP